MKYNFDAQINRHNTNSVKYDLWKESGKPEEIIPLWVADMDFSAPECVKEKLKEITDRGIFGYTLEGSGYYKSVQDWYRNYFNWETKREWIITTPGVLAAIALSIQCFTKEGDKIMIQPPVYHLFRETIEKNNRVSIDNPLVQADGRYVMDLEDFEKKIIKEKVKMYILCSPHNPVGRVWTEEELRAVGEICVRHKVLVVSDEIHGDLVYPGHRHHIMAEVLPELKEMTVICTAPSKTFNLAGFQTSNVFVPNLELRKKMINQMKALHMGNMGVMGYAACEAAYTEGREWLEELLVYIRGNYTYIKEYLEKNIPQITIGALEGTYLGWLDFSGLGLNQKELEEFCVNRAKLWLNEGSMFGETGAGYERVNLACPRRVLIQAMKQLKEAVDETV